MAHPYWPLFDLVVRTPRLELRAITDEIALDLAPRATSEMFLDGRPQFISDWLERPGRERSALQHWWRTRADLSADEWRLDLAVVAGGEPVGVQVLRASHFPVLRSVSTGSWLAHTHQGQGLGTEMRQAVLHLAFEGLGALEAHSAAFEENLRSVAVSERCGYEENGRAFRLRAGRERATERCFRLTAERHQERRRDDIEVEGLGPVLAQLGLTGDEPAQDR